MLKLLCDTIKTERERDREKERDVALEHRIKFIRKSFTLVALFTPR